MDTAETTAGLPPDVLDDLKAVAECLAAGRPVPSELARRARERSDKVQEQLLRHHGVREIAVDLVRRGRADGYASARSDRLSLGDRT
jgi:hypothetical protein